MDTMTPVYSSGTLLIIAAVAVAVLLVLIIALRMHAFVALRTRKERSRLSPDLVKRV